MQHASTLTPYLSAVDAVKRGWKVIPVHGLHREIPGLCTCGRPACPHPGKHPVEAKWQQGDGISLADCYGIWEEEHPEYNVGILTGKPSGVVLIDIDPRNGGREQLQQAIAEYGPLPQTYTTHTGSDGNHLYFALPDGATIPSGKLRLKNGDKLDGIDVLSDGRMAILPGSVSGSGRYEVELSVAIQALPDAWISAVTSRNSSTATEIVMAGDLPHYAQLSTRQQKRNDAYALKAIAGECEAYRDAGWGGGNNRLFAACCNMIEFLQSPWVGPEINESQVLLWLEGARAERYKRALKAYDRGETTELHGQLSHEVKMTWESAARRVRGRGRQMPTDDEDQGNTTLPTGSSAVTGGGTPFNPFMQFEEAEQLSEELITEAEKVAFEAAQRRNAELMEAVRRLDLAKEAREYIAARDKASPEEATPTLFLSGVDFLDAIDDDEPPLWGDGDSCLWASGESLMIVGPPGVGKSTLTQLVVWARIGLKDSVLSFKVTDDGRRVLYLAMDRPKQIARAMRRLVTLENREVLRERLVVHSGPLLVDITSNTEWLLKKAQEVGAGTIVVDSLKDILSDPSKEEPANLYNRSRQLCLTEGIEWVELHHNRKAGAENKAPKTLDDVYGSRWLTAGAGSVVSLYGQPGDTVVEMSQIKTPSGEFIPKNVTMNKEYGTMAFFEVTTLEGVLTAVGLSGVTAREAASRVYGTKSPTPSNLESTRNKLMRMVRKGTVETIIPPFTSVGTTDPTLFRWATHG